MLITNADDWGRSRSETDAALACFRAGRITSATAMVFMDDSIRAAEAGRDLGIGLGLHLNLSQRFTGSAPAGLREAHDRIVRFLTRGRYARLLYSPSLRRQFREVYEAQVEEFRRLYRREPTHIDGHHHQHLCTNMILGGVIESGRKVRRNFSFFPGEKSLFNRQYRKLIDLHLGRRYRMTDFFFSLSQCLPPGRLERAAGLAGTATVELMTHPANRAEYECLMGERYLALMRSVEQGSYASLR